MWRSTDPAKDRSRDDGEPRNAWPASLSTFGEVFGGGFSLRGGLAMLASKLFTRATWGGLPLWRKSTITEYFYLKTVLK
jgi:hypothetical protein